MNPIDYFIVGMWATFVFFPLSVPVMLMVHVACLNVIHLLFAPKSSTASAPDYVREKIDAYNYRVWSGTFLGRSCFVASVTFSILLPSLFCGYLNYSSHPQVIDAKMQARVAKAIGGLEARDHYGL